MAIFTQFWTLKSRMEVSAGLVSPEPCSLAPSHCVHERSLLCLCPSVCPSLVFWQDTSVTGWRSTLLALFLAKSPPSVLVFKHRHILNFWGLGLWHTKFFLFYQCMFVMHNKCIDDGDCCIHISPLDPFYSPFRPSHFSLPSPLLISMKSLSLFLIIFILLFELFILWASHTEKPCNI